MTSQELLSLFRSEVADTEQPYLWTDDEVLTYLTDAYRMFVRFLGGVPDASSPAATINYVAGSSSVPLSPTVLRITRAFREDGTELSVIDHTDAPLVRVNGKLALLRVGGVIGLPEFIIMGANPEVAELYPTPATDGVLSLQVRRLPAVALLAATDSLTEINVEHHLHLLSWVKSMAYRKHDAETFDPARAQDHEEAFLQYCSQAVHEYERLRRKSRIGLRAERDLKNPLLSGRGYRNYSSVANASQGRSNQPQE